MDKSDQSIFLEQAVNNYLSNETDDKRIYFQKPKLLFVLWFLIAICFSLVILIWNTEVNLLLRIQVQSAQVNAQEGFVELDISIPEDDQRFLLKDKDLVIKTHESDFVFNCKRSLSDRNGGSGANSSDQEMHGLTPNRTIKKLRCYDYLKENSSINISEISSKENLFVELEKIPLFSIILKRT